jgi:hypothetical protein
MKALKHIAVMRHKCFVEVMNSRSHGNYICVIWKQQSQLKTKHENES